VSRGIAPNAFFTGTYLGGVGASVALSLFALLLRPGMRLFAVLGLRLYVLIILGYSIGGFLSAKLVLGMGLMEESCALLGPPANLIFAFFALLAFALAQAFPVFFGVSGIADPAPLPSFDQLSTLCLVLALFALMTAWLARMAVRQKELADMNRLQEANLDSLAELNLNLQGYARTVDEESSERERNRISREIHDISGYIFTNLIALMDAAGSIRRDDQAALTDLLITARKTAQEGLRETRIALRKLRDDQPALISTPRAIYRIVSIFRKITGIEVELNLGNIPHFLSRELNLALYRTIQEALTNAVRHGKATRVRVNFWVEGDRLLLTITDNGKGAFEVVKGIGLTGMDERVGALGGTVSVGRATEGGFALSVQVPLRTEAEAGKL
jgi:signal transduction histidine kinase